MHYETEQACKGMIIICRLNVTEMVAVIVCVLLHKHPNSMNGRRSHPRRQGPGVVPAVRVGRVPRRAKLK